MCINSSLLLLAWTIIPCSWSDHNAVVPSFSSLVPRPNHTSWSINDSLLANLTYHLEIENALKKYLAHNVSSNISSLTVLEVHKPVIRGVCISQALHLCNEKRPVHKRLSEAFLKASAIFQASPFLSTKKDFEKVCIELDLFLTEPAEKSLRRSQKIPFTGNLINRICFLL